MMHAWGVTWSSILAGALRAEGVAALNRIAGLVCAAPARDDADADLGVGRAGRALFLSWLAAAGWESHADRARQLLDDAVDACVAEDPAPSGLHTGIAGIAWTMHHHARLHGDRSLAGTCAAVDEALVELVGSWSWQGDFDLISGLVGIGVYGLSRLPDPAAAVIVEGVVRALDEGAEARESGLAWRTPPELLPAHQRIAAPDGYHNLGVAHGVPGAIAFLAQASAAGLGDASARRLAEGAVHWMLAQRLAGEAQSAFPNWVAPGVPPGPARSAWCYGDPGIAAALMMAADCIDRPDWRETAISLMVQAVRRPRSDTGVVDAGLCHGAGGLGHLMNRMYHATAAATFAEAARTWFAEALAMWFADDANEVDHGFLEGSAGLGLALLAAITDRDPGWDAVLLISRA
jgi:lantibiotic modifying enzyme